MKSRIIHKCTFGFAMIVCLFTANCKKEKDLNNVLINEEASPGINGEIYDFIIDGDTITTERIDDRYIYQGDIILTEDQLKSNSNKSKGAGLSYIMSRWTYSTIYYKISSDLQSSKSRILEAIQHYEDNSILKFIERTTQSNYVEFIWDADGCYSNLGMVGGRQIIGLADWGNKGTVIHELGHTIGLIHEHCRYNRDQFIKVHFENIESGKEHNFNITDYYFATNGFDFNSIMLYYPYAFSKNTFATITKLDGSTYEINRNILSEDDKKIIELIYNNVTYDLPNVTTTIPDYIAMTSAIIGGTVVNDGGSKVTERGVFWGHLSNPETTGTKLKIGYNVGSYANMISGLAPKTTYFIKAYAVNDIGTGYGDQLSFTTISNVVPPSVTTTEVTNIDQNSAVVGGNVINNGDGTITEYGIYWGLSTNPVSTGTKLSIGNGIGPYSTTLIGLISNTTYFVIAYAVNEKGTSYGSEVNFSTVQNTSLPSVSTSSISSLTYTSAVIGGIVNSEGGDKVLETGVYWGTGAFLINTGTKLIIGSGGDPFSTNLTNLAPGVIYHVVAYATNSFGTSFGIPLKFNTVSDPSYNPTLTYGSVTDSDGNTYRTVKIGDQDWMAENLNVGRLISCDADPTDNNLIEKQTFYSDIDYANLYGGMYQWNEMMNYKIGEKSQGICPTGWHIPDKTDWEILLNKITSDGYGELQGKVLKSLIGWESGNGTDLYGFAVLPSGYKSVDSPVMYEKSARFWSLLLFGMFILNGGRITYPGIIYTI